MNKAAQWPRYTPTRCKYIGLSRLEAGLWRWVSLDWQGGGGTPEAPSVIGPQYKTRAEAMGDLERYIEDSGYGKV